MGLFVELADALSDLVVGGRCAGCGEAGRAVCVACRQLLAAPPRPCWPDPTPPGLPRPVCVTEYDGPVRNLLLGHKEHARYALSRALGTALAAAAGSAAAPRTSYVLVPVPSPRRVVRERGHDPVLRMTRVAAAILRAGGHEVGVVPCLRLVRSVRDQAGLGADARAANLAGAFEVWPRAQRIVGERDVVVVDDIVTTGATGVEAATALRASRASVIGLATVAATARRSPP